MFRTALPNPAPQYTRNRLYRVAASVLPTTAERLERYRRVRVGHRDATIQFRQDDVITFTFDPIQTHINPMDIVAYQNDLNSFFTDLNLPLDTQAAVSLHLTREAGQRGAVELGGLAQISMRFNTRPTIDLLSFLDMMEDRMYRGFDLRDIRVVADIRMVDFVRATFRGGNDSLGIIPDLPNSMYPLSLMDFWSVQAKTSFQKLYKKRAPAHLRNVKGLLFYKWTSGWEMQCSVMAIMYGVASQRVRAATIRLWKQDGHQLPISPCPAFMSRMLSPAHPHHHIIQPQLDACNMLENGEALYNAAYQLRQEYPISEFPSHFEIGEFFAQIYPSLVLVIVDESRHILFHRAGERVAHTDPPERGYVAERHCLTWDEFEKYNTQRVYIFYDHALQHYLPIFNLDRFFARQNMHQTVNPSLNPPPDPLPDIKNVCHRRVISCPFCDAGVTPHRLAAHTCHILRCRLCDTTFTNEHDRIAHCNPTMLKQTPVCRQCKRACFGFGCLRKHQAVCNGTGYIQCMQCFTTVASKGSRHHKCKSYECESCKHIVSNSINYYNPYHPEGYIQYHPCPMPAKEELAKVLSKQQSESHMDMKSFFVFDFECMLSSRHFKGYDIYVHTVNCISSANIILDVNDSTTKPTIATQYNLDDFWTHILEQSTNGETYWIAHNFKGYDGRLILDYFQSLNIVPEHLTWNGGKLMQLKIRHTNDADRIITFQDSLCHLSTSLANMPKMFGMDASIVKKGYFPYTFNTPQNQDYVGPIPDEVFFDVETIRDPLTFRAWYNAWGADGRLYNLRDEMTSYCENDVLVLSLSLSAYAKIGIRYSQINPLPYLTIAQFTFMHYRMIHMPSNVVYYLDKSFDEFARRSLHGGNTNVRRLHYECTPAEAGTLQSGDKGLRYIDVQSLYPTVQFYDPLPTGYPRTSFYYTQQPPEQTLDTFFGFIECDIAPIRYLHHPLLGRFENNRLFMDLHPHKKVVLTSVEFQLAISQRGGYKCTRVYRIDFYKPSYDLFRSFISTWLRLKITSSSLPYAADSEEFKEYTKELSRRFKMDVVGSDFMPNPSLRTLAKLVLNSLWGKFGQRSNLVECRILKTANDNFDYHQLVRMGHLKEITSTSLGTTAHMKKCQQLTKWNKKNVAIAAFVTAHARIRLWGVLEQLGDRVIYHDTDSVIYERRTSSDTMIKEGCFLGEWESETGDAMIHSFVGLAPKTYAYRYMGKDKQGNPVEIEQVKSKGFGMNAKTTSILNYDSYREMLRCSFAANNEVTGQLQVPYLIFKHCPEYGMTFTYNGQKLMRFNYEKGFVCRDTWMTFPYGSQLFYANDIFHNQRDLVSHPKPDPHDEDDRLAIDMLLALDTDGEDENDV